MIICFKDVHQIIIVQLDEQKKNLQKLIKIVGSQ